jgi:hypothetical protein
MRDFGGIKREGVVIWVTCSGFGFGWVCEMLTLNRPGFGGGIDPTEGWSYVSTEEVSA